MKETESNVMDSAPERTKLKIPHPHIEVSEQELKGMVDIPNLNLAFKFCFRWWKYKIW